jgi:hypothetical protein
MLFHDERVCQSIVKTRRLEPVRTGAHDGTDDTSSAIVPALERAGMEFLNHGEPSVRLRRAKRKRQGVCAPISSVGRLNDCAADALAEPDVAPLVARRTYPRKRKARSVCSPDRYLDLKRRRRRARR